MVWYTPWKSPFPQKTPEMNELEPDNNFLKIWTHNFEKQKSWSNLKKLEKKPGFFQNSYTSGAGALKG